MKQHPISWIGSPMTFDWSSYPMMTLSWDSATWNCQGVEATLMNRWLSHVCAPTDRLT